MDWESRCLRLCAGILLLAVLLRLGAGGAFEPVGRLLADETFTSFLVYLHTGRTVRLSQEVSALSPELLPVLTPTEGEDTDEPSAVCFTADDLSLVSVKYGCSYDPDLEALLTEPLDWQLQSEQPTVLIVHTHTTESYTKGPGDVYQESGSYRTLDPAYNLLCLGELITEKLEAAGIGVIHDVSFHDYPNYNGSYNDCAKSTEQYLEKYPSIQLILDLHRDAAQTDSGQLTTSCTVGGQSSAQLMFVVGTDEGGLSNPDWQDNLAVALKLQVLLERENPGICRSLSLAKYRYNQHLGNRALLIEIGAAGDTLDQAKTAAGALADAIIALAAGSA